MALLGLAAFSDYPLGFVGKKVRSAMKIGLAELDKTPLLVSTELALRGLPALLPAALLHTTPEPDTLALKGLFHELWAHVQ